MNATRAFAIQTLRLIRYGTSGGAAGVGKALIASCSFGLMSMFMGDPLQFTIEDHYYSHNQFAGEDYDIKEDAAQALFDVYKDEIKSSFTKHQCHLFKDYFLTNQQELKAWSEQDDEKIQAFGLLSYFMKKGYDLAAFDIFVHMGGHLGNEYKSS